MFHESTRGPLVRIGAFCALALAALTFPVGARTQVPASTVDSAGTGERRVPRRPAPLRTTATLLGGGFVYEFNANNEMARYIGVAIARSVTRYFESELRGGYASTATESVDPATLRVYRSSTPLVTGDLALRAQLPVWRLTPYVGALAGVVSLRPQVPGAKPITRPATGAIGGLKLALTRRVGMRGEGIVRRDNFPGHAAIDFAWQLGLTLGLGR